jgi:hypothetical protein
MPTSTPTASWRCAGVGSDTSRRVGNEYIAGSLRCIVPEPGIPDAGSGSDQCQVCISALGGETDSSGEGPDADPTVTLKGVVSRVGYTAPSVSCSAEAGPGRFPRFLVSFARRCCTFFLSLVQSPMSGRRDLPLLWRGDELEFGGEDLLHAVTPKSGMGSGPIPGYPILVHSYEAILVGRGYCGKERGDLTHQHLLALCGPSDTTLSQLVGDVFAVLRIHTQRGNRSSNPCGVTEGPPYPETNRRGIRRPIS